MVEKRVFDNFENLLLIFNSLMVKLFTVNETIIGSNPIWIELIQYVTSTCVWFYTTVFIESLVYLFKNSKNFPITDSVADRG